MRSGKRLRATLVACMAFSTALAVATTAQAAPRHRAALNCRSGRTVFHKGSIRAFVIVGQFEGGHQEGSSYKTFYVCSRDLRTPRRFQQGDPFTRETVYDYKVFAGRLGFVAYSEGVQSGSDTYIGWVDLRIGRARIGEIHGSEGLQSESEEEPAIPRVPDDRLDYAIAGDGTVAVLGEGGEPPEWEVCLLPVKSHALGPPRALFLAKAGQEGLDMHSLAITDTTVTWRTKKGQPASAPR